MTRNCSGGKMQERGCCLTMKHACSPDGDISSPNVTTSRLLTDNDHRRKKKSVNILDFRKRPFPLATFYFTLISICFYHVSLISAHSLRTGPMDRNLADSIPSKMPSLKPSKSPTSRPSKSPSKTPSKSPSKSPSRKPSHTPSYRPSSKPSSKPSKKPSSEPSLKPTTKPSSKPSLKPTTKPSSKPSLKPTTKPSSKPSLKPTTKPSSKPSLKPTTKPSSKPSSRPTTKPSSRPSSKPSSKPSKSPSLSPSSNPIAQPSSSPSLKPSSKPSRSPSSKPSASPTSKPSRSPSSSPSLLPSSSPSSSPTRSHLPSYVPSASPSDYPSTSPSFSPTLSLQSFEVKLQVTFDECDLLSATAQSIMTKVTSEKIQNEFEDLYGDESFDYLWVLATIIDQKPVTLSASARRLQTTDPAVLPDKGLEVSVKININFRSKIPFTLEDVQKDVGKAFDSETEKRVYIFALQTTVDKTFSKINKVVVSVDGTIITNVEKSDDSENKKSNIWVIVGPSIGGGLLLLGGLFIFMRRRKSQDNLPYRKDFDTQDIPAIDPRISKSIDVEPDDPDISTLGDPMVGPGGNLFVSSSFDRDHSASSSNVSADYDYNVAYGGAGDMPSVSTAGASKSFLGRGSSFLQNQNARTSSAVTLDSTANDTAVREQISVFSEDDSFEQQYGDEDEKIVVVAPAGKLGVVIDTPFGGVPMVHAIKETSVLADKVRIGDKLMSVDNEDTTTLSAIRVSKLISSKANNPKRILVFSRPRRED